MTTTPEPEAAATALLTSIETCAHQLVDLNARLDALLSARVSLYRAGVEMGVSKAAMARAAGCTPEAVIHTLKRSSDRASG